MRFLIDMGLPPKLVPFLLEQGHVASHLSDLEQNRLQDPQILAMAREEGSVLLAHDLDFPDLMAASGDRIPSVVVFRLRDMRPASVERHLMRVLAQCLPALEAGAVVSVTETLLRVRALPVERRRAGQ